MMVRKTPSAMTKPTDVATNKRKVSPSIRPSLMVCACSATAISAGSATTAENPIAKPKLSKIGIEPRRANWLAKLFPTGKILSSNPCRNRATPTATTNKPNVIVHTSSGT